MDELNELFNIEVDEFTKKAKSEEEIQKWCTKDDMTELQRSVFLLKKGYEIQKLAVINNLNRYCAEIGANEELLSLIIISLEDWDNKMQIECGNGFLAPIKNKLLSKDNKQRLLKLAVQIVTNDLNENEKLHETWYLVFDSIIGQVDFPYVQLVALKVIQELSDRKSTFIRRKLGHRLLFSLMHNCGEAAIDEDRTVLRLAMQICGDTNYKIRTEGSIFMKNYMKANYLALVGTNRLSQTYVPEICEMCNDEEIFIRVEAVEALSYVLETLDEELIEREFTPGVLKMLVSNHDEIIIKMSQIVGQLSFKMQSKGLHEKYTEEFMEFFKSVCVHKVEECRENAAFNLPCMNLIFRKYIIESPQLQSGLKFKPQRTITGVTASTSYDDEESKDENVEEFPFDFNMVYYQFSVDHNPKIKLITSHSIHEAFLAAHQDEDTTPLRDALHSLLQEGDQEIMIALIENIDVLIAQYCNTQATGNLTSSSLDEQQQTQLLPMLGLGKSSQEVKMSSTTTNKMGKTKLKRQDSLRENDDNNSDDNGQYVYLKDHIAEQVYSQFLSKFILFKQNFGKKIALWRNQVTLLDKLSKQISRFHMPEMQDKFVNIIFEDIQKGNIQVRQMCVRCLVSILVNQQDSSRRNLLTQQLRVDFGQSNSFQMRRVFIQFCSEAVGHMCRQYFFENFYQTYVSLASDKVANVRKDFGASLLHSVQTQLHDVVQALKKDSQQDVVEAIDQSDFELLKSRKKVVIVMQEHEEKNLIRQKKLDAREILENEEKKRRMEEDEEFRYYDYGNPASKNRLAPGIKTTTRSLLKGGPNAANGGQLTSKPNGVRKIPTSALNEKQPNVGTGLAKRKTITGNSKRNSSALPELNSGITQSSGKDSATGKNDDQKTRKNVMLPGRTAVDKIVFEKAEVEEDNYQRQLNQKEQHQSQITSKYKRSNSLLAPPSDSKTKLVKKISEQVTSPASGIHPGKDGVQYNYNYQKQRVGGKGKYDTASDSEGTPTLGQTSQSTGGKMVQTNFTSKVKSSQY